MQKSIQSYHFDQKKVGELLKKWVRESGLSYSEVAEQTGYSLDTINNSLSGKIKEPSLERVFKIAVLTGHSVCEFLRLMLEGDEIDFADRIHVLTDKPLHMVKYTDTLPAKAPATVPAEHHTDDATLDRFRRVHGDYAAAIREQTKQQLETMERQHRAHNDAMEKYHDEVVKALEKSHTEVVTQLERENKRLRRRSTWLTIALVVETLAVMAISIYDIINLDVGWYRGFLFPDGNSGIPGGLRG